MSDSPCVQVLIKNMSIGRVIVDHKHSHLTEGFTSFSAPRRQIERPIEGDLEPECRPHS